MLLVGDFARLRTAACSASNATAPISMSLSGLAELPNIKVSLVTALSFLRRGSMQELLRARRRIEALRAFARPISA